MYLKINYYIKEQADIIFVRFQAFNMLRCDEKSVAVDLSSSLYSPSTSGGSSSLHDQVFFHARALQLDVNESLCDLHMKSSVERTPGLMIAVTSSLKSFESRAKAIVRTWGAPTALRRARAIVHFFVGEDVSTLCC